ncbi:MAG TPA: barstar family protein [Microlunatus sp.]
MTSDDLDRLLAEPTTGGVVELADPAAITEPLTAAGWTVRVLDHFDDRAGFYRGVAAVLDFPSYFGHNLDALWDCLRDVPGPTALIIFWQRFADRDPRSALRIRSVLAERAAALPPFATIFVSPESPSDNGSAGPGSN